ncbi:replication protein [[Clostridium] sordellii]|uniref:replication protein n=1 Tax=Paraclostridium sordellii TaxID=1505 RepID=UPI0005DC9677|nr:replication protein [Paeniclostridium sordellii]CEP46376.1 replication protein [[Clostridium] sordellii] [Paeniclostridium sordellii]
MGQALEIQSKDEKNDTIAYLEKIHGNSKGWITRAEISNTKSFTQWHYIYKDLIKQSFDKENVYISMNTFYRTLRRIDTIKELTCNYIDLDTYNTKFTNDQILMNLNDNYFGKKIPIPNLIVKSGRGLNLIWSIEPVPHMALPLWKAIQEYLYKELKEFGADRKALDPTRILRVPGSINSKNGTRVEVIETNEYVWSLREIQKEFLPELDENRAKKKGRPKKVVYVHRERSLYLGRLLDIYKLCEIRNYEVKGQREIILFLYRYYLCYFYEDEEKALEDVLELNQMFNKPLRKKELIKATESAEKVFKSKDKNYKYKNDTLIELLQITDEEQTQMTVIIGKEEYKRRHRTRERNRYLNKLKMDGKMTKKEELKILMEKIKVLREEGLKNKDIAIRLDIPLNTLKRHITYMKKHGLLE